MVCNDWHTALLPVLLKDVFQPRGEFTATKTALVIHNVAFQVPPPGSPLATAHQAARATSPRVPRPLLPCSCVRPLSTGASADSRRAAAVNMRCLQVPLAETHRLPMRCCRPRVLPRGAGSLQAGGSSHRRQRGVWVGGTGPILGGAVGRAGPPRLLPGPLHLLRRHQPGAFPPPRRPPGGIPRRPAVSCQLMLAPAVPVELGHVGFSFGMAMRTGMRPQGGRGRPQPGGGARPPHRATEGAFPRLWAPRPGRAVK